MDSHDISYELALPSDIEGIFALALKYIPTQFSNAGPLLKAWTPKILRDHMNDSNSEIAVARGSQGLIFGFSLVLIRNPFPYPCLYPDQSNIGTEWGSIEGFFVHPKMQRYEIVKGLMDKTERILNRRGVKKAWLRVMQGDEPAQQSYEDHGYQKVERATTDKVFINDVMVKDIPKVL
ncbi:acyl-CoA N-acyltransferase [Whalleya microplaca]|nr:acyl-CoA N-acyltransferase [Whalleya microplaca]